VSLRTPRREFAADAAALAAALAYYGWLALRAPGTPTSVFVGEISFYPLGLLVGWMFLRNTRFTHLDRRTRAAWAILGAGALTLWLVGNTWPRVVVYFGVARYPGWVGLLEVVQHLLLIAAIAVFPGRSFEGRGRIRFLADVGLIAVAGFFLASYYGVRAAGRLSPASPPVVAFAQAVLDWAVFVVASIGVLHKRDATTRVVLGWLLVASLFYLGANYVLSLMPAYRMGDSVDGLWVAAWVCRWIAARFAWHRYRREAEGGVVAPDSPVTDFRSGVFSYVLVASALALLVGRVLLGEREHLTLFVVSSAAMAALLVLRQVLELRENSLLYASQLAGEARFRSLVQNASDVLLVVDAGPRVSYVGPSAGRILGEGALAPGRRATDVLEGPGVEELLPREGTGPRSPVVREARLRAADGRWREVEVAATDMRDDPAVAGVVLNCRDVTERREIEERLRRAQQLDAAGHLAGGLAHDLNNVLTVIRGYADLLREDLPPVTAGEGGVAAIENGVARASALTTKLLAFSRRQPVLRTDLAVDAALAELRVLLRQLLTDRIEVEIQCAPGLWPARADQGQLEQVVINLVTNARDAMPSGGRVAIQASNRVVPETDAAALGLAAGDYVALVVRDSGIGMDEEVRQSAFEPFFSTKKPAEGIGLGLSIVQGLVAAAGGAVSIDSAPGRGTAVTVLLPRGSDPGGQVE
jgi:PAS domain S-box-containing protein